MADLVRPHLITDEFGEMGYLLDLLARPAWHKDAACREHPELSWFPGRGRDTLKPKRVCASCLVLDDCRDWALAQGPTLHGIWGGLTAQDREALRNEKAA